MEIDDIEELEDVRIRCGLESEIDNTGDWAGDNGEEEEEGDNSEEMELGLKEEEEDSVGDVDVRDTGALEGGDDKGVEDGVK